MPNTSQLGILDLIVNAGPVGKFVLILLMFASVGSWAIILAKWKSLKRANAENAGFLEVFWHSKSIEDIFAKSDEYGASPVASVFKSGFKELKKLAGTDARPLDDNGVDNVGRALMRASNHEVSQLERQVGVLATVASAAPFVGLFGTVWGIIDAFHKIGITGSANLAAVAPGISEALIATAAGIGAAIPAVIAYNHFATQIKRMVTDMDNFSQDFLNIVQRSALTARKGS